MNIKRLYNKYFAFLSDAKKSALAFMFASFIQQGISFLITPLFTRLLSTEDFGVVSVYNSWVEMISTVAMLSLYAGLFNVGMMDYEEKRDEFTSSLLGLSNVATIITMILFYVIKILYPHIFDLPDSLIILMTIYFIFYPATRFWTARQRFEYKYKKLTFITISSSILSPLVGIICVLIAKDDLGIVRLWGTNSVIILFSVGFYINILSKDSGLFNKRYWEYALSFSIPLLPHYLAMHVLSASDKVMIQNLVGTSEAGIYGLAYTASMVVTVAWTAINGSLTPFVLNKLKKDKLDEIAPVAIPCILLFSFACVVVVLLAPEIILILGGDKYRNSIIVIPPLIASVLFMEMYNLFSIVEFYHKKTIFIMFATLAAAFLNIILNLLFIPKYGYVAAAYTTLVCYIGYCIFHYINMRYAEKRKIYNAKFFAIYSTIYVVICIGILGVYPYIWIRYGILVIYAILCFKFRKKIINLITSMR